MGNPPKGGIRLLFTKSEQWFESPMKKVTSAKIVSRRDKFIHDVIQLTGLEQAPSGRISMGIPPQGSLLDTTKQALKKEKISDTDNLALSLCLIWISRLFFLHLLQSAGVYIERLSGNNKTGSFSDLNQLFFGKSQYEKGFFRPTETEKASIEIKSLADKPFTAFSTSQAARLLPENTSDTTLRALLTLFAAYSFSLHEKADSLTANDLSILFEKINDYRHSAVFTPPFIAAWMCHEALRETTRSRNRLRILDPAVGTGHFLTAMLRHLCENPDTNTHKILSVKQLAEKHLFGTDINPTAVEVCKIRLMAEIAALSESQEIRETEAAFWADFSPQLQAADSLSQAAWPNQRFDVVIGNPPYGKSPENKGEDLYIRFMQQAANLCNANGLVSFIVPSSWLTAVRYEKLRDGIINTFVIKKITALPYDVFANCYVDTCIFLFKHKTRISQNSDCQVFAFNKKALLNVHTLEKTIWQTITQRDIASHPNLKILFNKLIYNIINRLKGNQYVPLGQISTSTIGVLLSKYSVKAQAEQGLHPLFTGSMNRYTINWETNQYIDLSAHGPTYQEHFFSPETFWVRRIVSRQNRLMCVIPPHRAVVKKDIYVFRLTQAGIPLHYILGLMNSRLFSWLYLESSAISTKDDFRQTTLLELRSLPIAVAAEETMNRIATLAAQIQELTARGETSKAIQTEAELDAQVAHLYGLTTAELEAMCAFFA